MASGLWEDFVSINSQAEVGGPVLGPASQYVAQADGSVSWSTSRIPLDVALKRDVAPLPLTKDREGYYGENHFNYWASGLRDYDEIALWADKNAFNIKTYLDIGAASGRVARAFHAQGGVKTYACDINRAHVDWMSYHLPRDIAVFQNHSIPTLPLPENCLDLVTAFSVFTHIETFDTTWLMELNRVIRPGGIAWLTIHGDRTWKEIKPDWPLHAPLQSMESYRNDRASAELPRPRTVYRWHADRSYTANIFYTYDYIRTVWGRAFDVVEIRPTLPPFQDVVILRKRT